MLSSPLRTFPRTELKAATAEHDGSLVLRLEGVVDSASVWLLRETVAAMAMPADVVMDLEAVSFMDSAGLGALIGTTRRVRQMGGQLAVAGPRRSIRRILHTTGTDRIFEVADTVAEAIASLQASRQTSAEPA